MCVRVCLFCCVVVCVCLLCVRLTNNRTMLEVFFKRCRTCFEHGSTHVGMFFEVCSKYVRLLSVVFMCLYLFRAFSKVFDCFRRVSNCFESVSICVRKVFETVSNCVSMCFRNSFDLF